MYVLGIETSCDECSASVVKDGKEILSNNIATQIELHKPYYGVVPEIASRLHTEWIDQVVLKAMDDAGIEFSDLDGIAVTSHPGLVGSLLVGLSYSKALSYALNIPYIGVNHIKAHIFAANLEFDNIPYPHISLLVSGGHTLITKIDGYDQMTIMGTTIDDACGEAFDKVAKYFDFGYPGGVAIDKLSKEGNPRAYQFPKPNLHKGDHKYDFSYSGLKTAVIHQHNQFKKIEGEGTPADLAASFQKTAIDILVGKLKKAVAASGINTVVLGGGVAANSYLRESIDQLTTINSFYPSLKLCTDNGAMIAGLGTKYLQDGMSSELSESVLSALPALKKKYP